MNRLRSFPGPGLAVALLLPVLASAQWATTPVVRPRIIAEIPHDTGAFTQGLLWLDGKLYESAGLYGRSALREIDPATGKVLRARALPARYFAEGLAWYRGEFLQITWREGEALRWRRSAWDAPAGGFRYAGEGWGLAALPGGRDTTLWMSNGSDTLFRRDASFGIAARLPVRLDGRPLARLNELEGADGRLVANVWYSDSLYVIDPRTGRVLALVDASELVARSGRRTSDDVLNGLAWDPARHEFYVTGKNWPKMFRVKIPGF